MRAKIQCNLAQGGVKATVLQMIAQSHFIEEYYHLYLAALVDPLHPI